MMRDLYDGIDIARSDTITACPGCHRTQEPTLFGIRLQRYSLWRLDAAGREVRAAAVAANAISFIEQLPEASIHQ